MSKVGPFVELTLRNGSVHRTSGIATHTGERLNAAEVVSRIGRSESGFILLDMEYAVRCSEIVMVRVIDEMDS
jgi:hypothetical protein